MPLPAGNGVSAGVVVLAMGLLGSGGQTVDESPVVVTVPLHQTEGTPSYSPSASVSGDGRFIAFVSFARLAPADTNDRADIYVLNRDSGAVTLETADSTSIVESTPVISARGQVLVYVAAADRDPEPIQILMVRDRAAGVARPLQRAGRRPDRSSRAPSISADGRYVAFTSSATNLVDGPDANGAGEDVYVADTASMSFRRVSTNGAGLQPAEGASFAPSISDDGRFVAFSSSAGLDATAPGSALRMVNTYVKDLQTGTTTRVSAGAGSRAPNGPSHSAAISGDGRYVAFVSEATNLVPRSNGHGTANVYVRDLLTNATELISRTPSRQPGNGPSRQPALSADGRLVVFESDASDLTCGEHCPLADRDINLVTDIFRHDRRTGITERISRGRTPWMEPSIGPGVDRAGAVITFASRHPLDQADDRHDYDLFVWARQVSR